MKTFGKKGYITTGIILGIFISSLVYASSQITSLSQEVKDGDIITASWYNSVKNMLGGTHTNGGTCSYISGKILCNGTGGGGTSPGPGATPMYKSVYKDWEGTVETRVASWNALVNEALTNNPGLDSTGSGWREACRISNSTKAIPDGAGATSGANVQQIIDRCGRIICRDGKKHGHSVSEIVHCGTGHPACPKGNYDIVCMY